MSVRPGSSGSSDYREIRLPDTLAVNTFIWFCGRNPRKAKSIRRYYDDDFDARSTGSSGSVFSWASGTSRVCLVESTNPDYWDDSSDSASYSSSSSKKRKSKGRGRSSRASQRSVPVPVPVRTSTWERQATVQDADEEDDSSSDGSFEDYGGPYPGHFPHPGMMQMPPPPGPPPGAFQPVYGMYPQHATPRPLHPTGFAHHPPPPPPPPPGGHFVADSNGIQVFVDG